MIYNAIDLQRFTFSKTAREAIRRELGWEEKNIYGFSGRIVVGKNPLFLMQVFAEISKLDPNAAFLVCGDGNMRAETENLARSLELSVHFAGSCVNIQDYYCAMDAFLLPSLAEGLGLVLIEAQTAGLPSVTSADVVPNEAKVTELLEYVSLEESAEYWAKRCVDKLLHAPKQREPYAAIVGATPFDIRNEAPRLGQILCGETPNEK